MRGVAKGAQWRGEAAWSAGHQAARPAVRAAAVTSVAAAVATMVVGLALSGSASGDVTTTVVGVAGYALVLVVLGYAGVRADRAARAVPEPPG